MRLRLLFSVILCIFSTVSQGQFSLVRFPDSASRVSLFTKPRTTPKAIAPFYGILTIGQPYDSLNWETYYKNQPQYVISDSLRKRFSTNKGLSIVIDPFQTVACRAYLPADSTGIQYFRDTSAGKDIAIRDPYTIKVAGMPVYILNLTDNEIRIRHPKYSLVLIQQALLANGQWVDIEQHPIGLLKQLSIHTLKKGELIVTVMPKYKGGFFTKLRVKFTAGAGIYYSEEFWGEINKAQVIKFRK